MKTKINKFGFELEGEFKEALISDLQDLESGNFKGDGSINLCGNHNGDWSAIEFASNPFDFTRAGKQKAKRFFELLQEGENNGCYHFNDSMGFHIHLSFRPKVPVEVWSAEFNKFFFERFARRFPATFRKRRNNTYCKATLSEYDIAFGNDRYRGINFKPAFQLHSTIEFRIFPATKVKTLQQFLGFTFRTVNDFLKRSEELLKREELAEIEDNLPSESVQEISVSDSESNIVSILDSTSVDNLTINENV